MGGYIGDYSSIGDYIGFRVLGLNSLKGVIEGIVYGTTIGVM